MDSTKGVALVTGGAGAIGGAVCALLAGAGHNVATADLDPVAATAKAADLAGGPHLVPWPGTLGVFPRGLGVSGKARRRGGAGLR